VPTFCNLMHFPIKLESYSVVAVNLASEAYMAIIDFVNKNPFNKVLKPHISQSTVISSSLCRVLEEVIISFVLTKSFPYHQIRHVVTPNIDLHASRGRCSQ